MPDGMTIDVSGVDKMDTVGAWLIYRAVRDRGAKVVGASEDVAGLLEQVKQADKPARVIPEEEGTAVSSGRSPSLANMSSTPAGSSTACSISSARRCSASGTSSSGRSSASA